jgi:hypothetical protein
VLFSRNKLRAHGSLRSLPLARLSRVDVPVINDWAMAPLAETERREFWESVKTAVKPARPS